MKLTDFLIPARISYKYPAQTKKAALEHLSHSLSVDTDLEPKQLFRHLSSREKLGSTAIGHGCAIPHARIPGITAPIIAVLTLASPIDCDAPDDKPVNFMVGLLVPEETPQEHLELLAQIATLLDNSDFRTSLTETENASEVYQLLLRKQPANP